MVLNNGLILRRLLFCAVVNITHACHLKTLAGRCVISVIQIVAGEQGAFKLDIGLRKILFFAGDTVHIIIAHIQRIVGLVITKMALTLNKSIKRIIFIGVDNSTI